MTAIINSTSMDSVISAFKLEAFDDASSATLVSIADILSGKKTMAFGHVFILEKYYASTGNKDPRFNCVLKLSQLRNVRVIRKVNSRIRKLKEDGTINSSVLELTITDEMTALFNSQESLYSEAIGLNIDPTKYFDEDLDIDDVEQCTDGSERTKNFCLDNQQSEPGKAADNVKILRGTDGDYLVVIKRAFGPGRGCCAFAGGLVEDGETSKECAIREGDEEVQMTIHGLEYKSTTYEMEPVHTYWWDPRARFPHGMINGALVTLMDFGDMNIM